LASSSAIVGTRAMLQWPRSPRSHPRNPRFSNSESSRLVFALDVPATLEGWINLPGAGGDDRSLRAVKFETGRFPF
jgi:hypothetical protein